MARELPGKLYCLHEILPVGSQGWEKYIKKQKQYLLLRQSKMNIYMIQDAFAGDNVIP